MPDFREKFAWRNGRGKCRGGGVHSTPPPPRPVCYKNRKEKVHNMEDFSNIFFFLQKGCWRLNARGGGSTQLSFGRGVLLGGENRTLSQTARRTKTTPCHNIPYKKLSYAYPVLVRTDSLFCCVSSYIHKNLLLSRTRLHWCRDRRPVINIVGWEATLW